MSIVPRLFGNCPFLHVILDPSSSPTDSSSPNANPQVDWKETPEAHVFIVDLPGLKKQDVKVEIDDERVLQICGERNIESDNKSEKWHRVERGRGKFCRRFRLPENAKDDEVKATMVDGVLTVWIPKQELKKSEVKVIEIEG